jgi:hypothetical protein
MRLFAQIAHAEPALTDERWLLSVCYPKAALATGRGHRWWAVPTRRHPAISS